MRENSSSNNSPYLVKNKTGVAYCIHLDMPGPQTEIAIFVLSAKLKPNPHVKCDFIVVYVCAHLCQNSKTHMQCKNYSPMYSFICKIKLIKRNQSKVHKLYVWLKIFISLKLSI